MLDQQGADQECEVKTCLCICDHCRQVCLCHTDRTDLQSASRHNRASVFKQIIDGLSSWLPMNFAICLIIG